MKAVIQRVISASVSVDGSVVSSIGRGICVLIGLSRDDTDKEIEYIVRKILNVRLFDGDDDKRWCKSVMDKQFSVLCVSQFTLYGVLKGNKPDFHFAMANEQSREFYVRFLERLRASYKPDLVHDGQFGAYMQVSIENDGPVTISLDSIDMGKDPRDVKKTKCDRSEKQDSSLAQSPDTTNALQMESLSDALSKHNSLVKQSTD